MEDSMEHVFDSRLNNPKVSVIMPVYNCEAFLDESINTFLSQTLRVSELICIDDGSTDNSINILNHYKQRYPERIEIIKQDNQGPGPARNAGIKKANGDFIYFLDSDDAIPKETTLERLYNCAVTHKVLIAGGSITHAYETEDISSFADLEHFEGLQFTGEGYVNYNSYQFDFAYYRFIYSRRLIVENNILFPSYLRYEDPPFFVTAMLRAGIFYAIPDVTYRHRACYRDLKWSSRQVIDLISGISDVAYLACENNLEKLFHLNLFRLSEYNKVIETALLENPNGEVFAALLKFKERLASFKSIT